MAGYTAFLVDNIYVVDNTRKESFWNSLEILTGSGLFLLKAAVCTSFMSDSWPLFSGGQ